MPLGQRQLFIYWHVASTDLPQALQALRDWQYGLVARHPALRCGLYQRVDSGQADATVMETYAIESALPHSGIDEALHQFIDQDGQAQLTRWLRGRRHVEVFDALPA
jgi:hypothetical protein